MRIVKQWRWKRTRMNKLLSLGVARWKTEHFVFIDRGWWYLASLYATQWGMNNKRLAEQGLVSIKNLWVKIHYPDTPRLSLVTPFCCVKSLGAERTRSDL